MRRKGDGGCTQRKDGRWQVSEYLGPPPKKYFYGKTPLEALNKLKAARSAHARGELLASSRQTVSAYLDMWLRDSIKPNKSWSTYHAYTWACTHLKQELGHYALGDLRPAHIQRAYNALGSKLSPTSVSLMHRAFHVALAQAVKWRMIPTNTSALVVLPKISERDRTLLDADGAARLIEATVGDRFHALWVLMLGTGLRIGEASALRWSDIDLKAGTLTVRHSAGFRTGQGMVIGDVKTPRSRRILRLGSSTVEALRAHLDAQRFEKVQNDLVFRSELGNVMSRPKIAYHFERALKKAGLPRMRLHELRHSMATMALNTPGVSQATVAKRLGDSVTTMNRVYAHATDANEQYLADVMDDAFQGRGNANGVSKGV